MARKREGIKRPVSVLELCCSFRPVLWLVARQVWLGLHEMCEILAVAEVIRLRLQGSSARSEVERTLMSRRHGCRD